MKKIYSLLLCIVLAGCAGTNKTKTTTFFGQDGKATSSVVDSTPESPLGESDYSKHVDGKARHIESEGKRITAQTTAIMQAPLPANPEAAAYANGMKILAVAQLKPEPYGEAAPETIVGLGKELVRGIPIVWAVDRMGKLGEVGIKNAGSSYGDNVQLSNSGNRTDSQSTVTGQNNSGSSTAAGTGEPTVVKVEPVFGPSE